MILGVDIGGSHITAAWVDAATHAVHKNYVRSELNASGSAEEIVAAWSDVINRAFALHPQAIKKTGIAMPGPFDYAAGVSYIKDNRKYEALYGLNVKQRLAETLSLPPSHIRFMNDAAAFLQGEALAGAVRHYTNSIGITLGTGLGTAIYKNGQARNADLWQLPFLNGIAEEYISARWFISRYEALTGIRVAGVKDIRDQFDASGEARQVFDEFAIHLARFIEQFAAAHHPEAVVLGGNISRAADRFLPAVQTQLQQRSLHLPIHVAVLKEDAAIIGAAGCFM